MDTTESAESAHSPASSPSRSRCPQPAQPGYLSARIWPRAVSTLAPCPPPTEPEDRLAPARPRAPSTSALALYPPPLPWPVPGALAKSELSLVARLAFSVRSLRLPPCRSEGFWRPWVRTPGEREERTKPLAAEATILAQVQVLRLLISRSRNSSEKFPNSSYNFIL
ncbi:protein ripply2 isoform X2 [Apodemus sylvaticus]|uniref:protein ripply2 isoform X2 n=1 Tax=Apodemus sylvaticus TaxID=10129 RepID=UPI002244B535|nr:protein ripply2 isoform X2 [Apodemus sylvaticus]